MDGLASALVEELRARYNLGHVVHLVRYDRSGDFEGPLVLSSLSKALCMHPSALRRYARVSEAVAPREFDALLSLRGRHSLPLTWSHIEILAERAPAKARLAIAQDAIARNLSVRDLVAMLNETSS
jgi:hypothetical protein